MSPKTTPKDERGEAETKRLSDAVLRRMLSTPPTEHLKKRKKPRSRHK